MVPKTITPERIVENFQVFIGEIVQIFSRICPHLISSLTLLAPTLKWLFTSLQVFDFELTEEEMKTISGFNRNWRFNPMQW